MYVYVCTRHYIRSCTPAAGCAGLYISGRVALDKVHGVTERVASLRLEITVLQHRSARLQLESAAEEAVVAGGGGAGGAIKYVLVLPGCMRCATTLLYVANAVFLSPRVQRVPAMCMLLPCLRLCSLSSQDVQVALQLQKADRELQATRAAIRHTTRMLKQAMVRPLTTLGQ